MAPALLSSLVQTQTVRNPHTRKGTAMKAVIGLGAGAAVLAMAGIEGFSGGVASLAALAAVVCWMMSGWIVE